MAAEKRPHDSDPTQTSTPKRARSNEPSPAPAPPSTAAPRPPSNIQDQIAAIKARAAAARSQTPTTQQPQSPADAARAKIEAMKARVAAATSNAGKSQQGLPQRTASPAGQYQTPHPPPSEYDDGGSRARGGLGTALHPALLAEAQAGGERQQLKKGPMQTRFGTTMGNRRPVVESAQVDGRSGSGSGAGAGGDNKGRKQLDLSAPSLEELKKDPYFDPSVGGAGAPPRARKSRDLLFHQKGKFIAQASALRRQAQLEAMKKRIAEASKKAGLDEDRSEQAFLVPEPPKVEWWDEGLVTGEVYPDFDGDGMEAEKALKIDTEDSVVTRYVQHPVLLQPPQEKNMPAPKPMFMTKTEQAKKRRQDRMEARKEQQAKVRLGLEPPEPPKIKKSNLMRVLGEQAVKDPTAVEAQVNKQVAERAEKHEVTNAERALSKEEKAEKLAQQQEADAKKGIMCCVFRIDSLAFGKHRYLVDVNAKQQALTGTVILHPRCNLVIVEGGQHSIRAYKKVMLQRIRWTDIEVPTDRSLENEREHHKDVAEKGWLQAVDERGELKDHSTNRCVLVWEGEEKDRAFRKWGSRVCETDAEARRALEKNKMENMWQLARNWSD